MRVGIGGSEGERREGSGDGRRSSGRTRAPRMRTASWAACCSWERRRPARGRGWRATEEIPLRVSMRRLGWERARGMRKRRGRGRQRVEYEKASTGIGLNTHVVGRAAASAALWLMIGRGGSTARGASDEGRAHGVEAAAGSTLPGNCSNNLGESAKSGTGEWREVRGAGSRGDAYPRALIASLFPQNLI